MGRKGPIWSRIVLVPSVSLALLESGKVLGSILALLGGNMASPPDSAHSISAEALVLGTGSFWWSVWHLN